VVSNSSGKQNERKRKMQKISIRLAIPMMLVSNKAKEVRKRGYFCLYVIQSWLVSSRTIFFFFFCGNGISVSRNHLHRRGIDNQYEENKKERKEQIRLSATIRSFLY
jgi:Na+/melibiose symporter-like transporter